MTAPNITGTTPLSSTSFIVNWTITDPDHNYIVTWTNLHTCVIDNMTVPENTSNHMVTGLDGVSNYNVSVAANNSCGMMMSEPVTVYGNVYIHMYVSAYIYSIRSINISPIKILCYAVFYKISYSTLEIIV